VLLCICIVIIIIGGENDSGSRIITVFVTKASWKKRWCLERNQADEGEVYRAVSGCLSATVVVS
jgi:hypothetical protein